MRRKERKIPPVESRALAILRTRVDWTQKELSAATGIPANLISDYERGHKNLTLERLGFMLTSMGIQPSAGLKDAMRFLKGEEAREPDPPDPESRQIEAIAADSGRLMADFSRSLMQLLTSQGQALEARQQARSLWEGLKRRDPEKRRLLVETVAKFRNWALSELLCEESIKAAGDSADRALELANLALRVAELIPGDEVWRQRVQGYAWAHVGNARRVKGDLPSADEAFGRFQKLWSADADGDAGLLNEARVLGLRASLLRDQRRLTEALELLDRALVVNKSDEAKYLLLNQAKIFEEMDDFGRAVNSLRELSPSIESGGETRLLFVMKHNLAVNLCALGEYEEVSQLLPNLKKLALKLKNGLDLLRVQWLEGRLLVGLEKSNEAIRTFFAVREELISRGEAYDAALVSLEIAVIYLESGRIEAVKNLARQMASVFRLQGIHREALAALKLFRDAAEREVVTVELTQKVVQYLRRAKNNPSLHFEP